MSHSQSAPVARPMMAANSGGSAACCQPWTLEMHMAVRQTCETDANPGTAVFDSWWYGTAPPQERTAVAWSGDARNPDALSVRPANRAFESECSVTWAMVMVF